MNESLKNLLSPRRREEAKTEKQVQGVMYGLSVMNNETMSKVAELLKKMGMNVEISEEGLRHFLTIYPLYPLEIMGFGIEYHRVYVHPNNPLQNAVRVMLKGGKAETKYGDLSEIGSSIKHDIERIKELKPRK